MVKKCKVISKNAVNMVIRYDGIEVQLPTDDSCDRDVYINKIGNKFFLSSEDEFKKVERKKSKKMEVTELVIDDIKVDELN